MYDVKKYNKEYREKNKDRLKGISQKWYKANQKEQQRKAREHYHIHKDSINAIRRIRPSSLISKMRMNARNRGLQFALELTSFTEWFNAQEKKCTYCSIPVDRIKADGKGIRRSTTLSIDRKDNSRGYLLENIALACMKCNFIKSDLLEYSEMQEIGQKYLRPKWEKGKI